VGEKNLDSDPFVTEICQATILEILKIGTRNLEIAIFLLFPIPGKLLRWGWVFLERTRILSGIQFTTYFIEIFVVEMKRFVGSFVHVILTRQTCWPQVCRVKITFTKLPTNRFISTTKISMKYVVDWIPLRIRVRSRNTQPHLKGFLGRWKNWKVSITTISNFPKFRWNY